MSKESMKPISLALGAVFVSSLAASDLSADINMNPFTLNELSSGYMQLADASSTNKIRPRR